MNRLLSSIKRLALSQALLLALAAPAVHAQTRTSDGIANLDQALALAGSATPGDAPGFPITITKAGTYRLTSTLLVPAGADGIVVAPGLSVTIDLNGFHIVGAATCSKTTSCGVGEPAGTAGIRTGSESSMVKVSNGRIRGFTFAGVVATESSVMTSLTGQVTLEDVQLVNNNRGVIAGVLFANRVLVKDNGGGGLRAETGLVQSSMAIRNGYDGFWVHGTGRISDSVAIDNEQVGFRGSSDGKVLMHSNVGRGNGTNSYAGVTATNAF